MAKKVAILGGGIGSLTTAMEMTNDPNWKNDFDITIYQMGWRLGGKGASGRNRKMSDRIQEHGIHLWMGFYENAFHMIRAAYKEATLKNLMPTSPFKDARDAFSPMNYTPMMEQFKGKWQQWDIHWPPNSEFPGDDTLFSAASRPPPRLDLRNYFSRTSRIISTKPKLSTRLSSDSMNSGSGTWLMRWGLGRRCLPRQRPRDHTQRFTQFQHSSKPSTLT